MCLFKEGSPKGTLWNPCFTLCCCGSVCLGRLPPSNFIPGRSSPRSDWILCQGPPVSSTPCSPAQGLRAAASAGRAHPPGFSSPALPLQDSPPWAPHSFPAFCPTRGETGCLSGPPLPEPCSETPNAGADPLNSASGHHQPGQEEPPSWK